MILVSGKIYVVHAWSRFASHRRDIHIALDSRSINDQLGGQVGEKISFGIRILSSLTACAVLLVRGAVMVMRAARVDVAHRNMQVDIDTSTFIYILQFITPFVPSITGYSGGDAATTTIPFANSTQIVDNKIPFQEVSYNFRSALLRVRCATAFVPWLQSASFAFTLFLSAAIGISTNVLQTSLFGLAGQVRAWDG